MLKHGDYVYYVSPDNGVTVEYVRKRDDGILCLEYDSTGITFDNEGYTNISDLFPSIIPSTVKNYHALVTLYGDDVVQKPMIELDRKETLSHLCETRPFGVLCFNNKTKTHVNIFSITGDMCTDNSHKEIYHYSDLTPVNSDTTPIGKINKLYTGESSMKTDIMTFDEARFITQYIKSDCIYHGYKLLQDGEIIDPHNIIVDENGVYIQHNNITHVLFVNDPEVDEGLYCTKEAWVNRSFIDGKSFVKTVDITDMIKGIL